MSHWLDSAFFYQIYPLGATGAPMPNDGGPVVPRLRTLEPWLEHARSLGANALYLGPVFESDAHGYDTRNFLVPDRRLGTEDDLAAFVARAHEVGLRVLFDAVFPHVGRGFWAFRELAENGPASGWRDWFRDVDFSRRGPFDTPFSYAYWRDAPELPRLNLANPGVREHLFLALDTWRTRYGIDGVRLDSADCLDADFLAALRADVEAHDPEFLLLGETIHGDYRQWVHARALHSVTNYEAYKGLWSSHKDRNFFEIAYTLKRQFGEGGLYRGFPLYSFVDNHDVNRIGSQAPSRASLFSIHCLLFTMPGVPAIYQGSEWGIPGVRTPSDDRTLRPHLDLATVRAREADDLPGAIRRLATLRAEHAALRTGDYTELAVAAEQLAFRRRTAGSDLVVAVNGADTQAAVTVTLADTERGTLRDVLDPGPQVALERGRATLSVPPHWARVLEVRR